MSQLWNTCPSLRQIQWNFKSNFGEISSGTQPNTQLLASHLWWRGLFHSNAKLYDGYHIITLPRVMARVVMVTRRVAMVTTPPPPPCIDGISRVVVLYTVLCLYIIHCRGSVLSQCKTLTLPTFTCTFNVLHYSIVMYIITLLLECFALENTALKCIYTSINAHQSTIPDVYPGVCLQCTQSHSEILIFSTICNYLKSCWYDEADVFWKDMFRLSSTILIIIFPLVMATTWLPWQLYNNRARVLCVRVMAGVVIATPCVAMAALCLCVNRNILQ